MGIIKAFFNSVGGGLADQWLESVEADNMTNTTLATYGVMVRKDDKRNSNRKGTADTVSNGSLIHVYENQFMMLVDGGKIVDYTAEPGYYKVDNSSMPSMFNGQFGDSLKETFSRIKYGGAAPTKQQVVFINLQGIPGIKFGTPAPIGYYDRTLDLDLQLRSHGTFMLKVENPLKFYGEVVPKNGEVLDFGPGMDADSSAGQIKQSLLSEFIGEYQAALNRLSDDNIRVTQLMSQSPSLTKYMRDAMDEEWRSIRGLEVVTVGISSVTLSDDSQAIMNERTRTMAYKDPAALNAYMGTAIARGMESAGKNEGGAMNAFLGMGVGMQNSGVGAIMQGNQTMMQQQAANTQQQAQAPAAADPNTWKCSCGKENVGNFCAECGGKKIEPVVAGAWQCSCGNVVDGKFCSNCGNKKQEAKACSKCGNTGMASEAKFCPECGETL